MFEVLEVPSHSVLFLIVLTYTFGDLHHTQMDFSLPAVWGLREFVLAIPLRSGKNHI